MATMKNPTSHVPDVVSKSSPEDSDRAVNPADPFAIQELAKQLSNASERELTTNHLFNTTNPALNPNSDSFRPEEWIAALLDLASDETHHLRRTTGIAFQNLNVFGSSRSLNFQGNVGNVHIQAKDFIQGYFGSRRKRVSILQNMDGLVKPGELLVVLGPPGSGCSTFLKTIAGETHGINIEEGSKFNYLGIGFDDMHSRFKGEAIYTAEQDVHFPILTVGETLEFAACARSPRVIPGNIDKRVFAKHLRDVLMAVFGIRHTVNTPVGDEYVRGISGGERKRVTIAEAALNGSPLQCWDNSTRGLDSANAIEFCKTLRLTANMIQTTAAVAIYQAPQAAYDYFDKVLVLDQGRQIYFGPAKEARGYFERMGFECPERQTVPDFLTSMTSPLERSVRSGFENKVPRTPDDFAQVWKLSPERQKLNDDIDRFCEDHPIHGPDFDAFQKSRNMQQAKSQREKSPFTLSYWQQIKLCIWRAQRRIIRDPALIAFQIISNMILVVIVSSMFSQLPSTTSAIQSRGALIFFAIMINAFSSALDILMLYAQRPIVEKHSRYALYHPSAEAIASLLLALPVKTFNSVMFSLIMYWMTGLKREAGAFFFFVVTSLLMTLVMSSLFRTIGSVTRSMTQASVPTGVAMLALVIYSGFVIPVQYMHGWSRWINYIDPISYGLEALMINEFRDHQFACSAFVPSGPGYDTTPATRVCTQSGSTSGNDWVSGNTYIESSFQIKHSHKWRNIGIMLGFWVAFTVTHIVATDAISAKKSKGEVLVFPYGKGPRQAKKTNEELEQDSEGGFPLDLLGVEGRVPASIAHQTALFQWQDVCYDLKIKGETRRILDHVDGWVKPGTLTALMGVSGAGKTTLLDVLASRRTIGFISGQILVDGEQRDSSFQRKTGYAQQQDLHLATATVRESLQFSAMLRQPRHVPRSEKLEYVEEIIRLLEMDEIADAIVGVLGEGLNVEQRKRLTIGVELAAKPELLLFLDEPTSGLDSQTSWSILMLLQKLKNNGQAILCTIHQPSAMLLEQFDRLLLLHSNGKTVYFGPIGPSGATMLSYFRENGGFKCPDDANPAEYMLEVTGVAPGAHSDIDWPLVWTNSVERENVRKQLNEWKNSSVNHSTTESDVKKSQESYAEFAAPIHAQLYETLVRIFQQYWRSPIYIYSKLSFVTLNGLFIGFSFFNAKNTQQGLQNQLYGLFLLMSIFSLLAQQVMPHFVSQRALYEARERPAKTYSWYAFMLSNILVEIPWSVLSSVFLYFTWYYPIGLYRNAEATDSTHEKGVLTWLFILLFMLFATTFSHLTISTIQNVELAGSLSDIAFSLTVTFCGVLAGPDAFPRFWIFMYRISPFHYLVSGLLAAMVGGAKVICAGNEYLHFDPPNNSTCGQYMDLYIQRAGGYLEDPAATKDCSFCLISETNRFLEGTVHAKPGDEWKNFGIMWAYIVFNICCATFLYWLVRVPKKIKVHETPLMEGTDQPGPDKPAT